MSKTVYAVYTGEYEDTRILNPLYTNKGAADKAIRMYKERDRVSHARLLNIAAEQYAKTCLKCDHPSNIRYTEEDYWIEEYDLEEIAEYKHNKE